MSGDAAPPGPAAVHALGEPPSDAPVVATRVAILAVHGIGEQKPGEFACKLAADLGDAIRAEYPRARPVWEARDCGEADARLHLHLESDRAGAERETLTFDFHEGYWADLDDRGGLLNFLRFWTWGFSVWADAGFLQRDLPGARHMAAKREENQLTKKDRSMLLGAAIVFANVALTLRLAVQFLYLVPVAGPWLNKVFALLFRGKGPLDLIYDYMGDVKLYQDNRLARSPLERRGERPRVAIRRRVLRRMADIALADYDRWYVFAHSLGTVPAFDALNETGAAIPNYLDPDRCDKLRQKGWLRPSGEPVPEKQRPQRPAYLAPDETLDRSGFFLRLRGFLTYGSPLDKFAAIWPWISPSNEERYVFAPDFEWINVYERADPVGAHLSGLSMTDARRTRPGQPPGPLPRNFGYDKQPLLAKAHTAYFAKPTKRDGLACAVADWLLSPHRAFPHQRTRPSPGGSEGDLCRFTVLAQLALLTAVSVAAGAALLGLAYSLLLESWPDWTRDNLPALSWTWRLVVGAGLIVGTTSALVVGIGGARFLRRRWRTARQR